MPASSFGSGDRFDSFMQAIQAIKLNAVPPSSSIATIRISAVITTVNQKIVTANSARLGLVLYNNSANSVYLALGSAANSSTNMTYILATFAHLVFPAPLYLGDVYAIRNSGTGTVLCTELT